MSDVPTTSCRHCGLSWPAPVPIVGQPEGAAYFEFLGKLVSGHLRSKHPRELGKVLSLVMELSQVFYFREFQSIDPEFLAHIDRVRSKAHQLTRRVHASDEDLAEALAALPVVKPPPGYSNSTSEALLDRGEVLELLRQFRDRYEEIIPTSTEFPGVVLPAGMSF